MPTLHETVYPRLPSDPSARELQELYTPSHAEIALAHRHAREATSVFGFLVLLKTFQRLGYFIMLRDVPEAIVDQVAESVGLLILPNIRTYDESGTRSRHLNLIREYLGVQVFNDTGRTVLEDGLRDLARSKQDLRDLINGAVELLVKESFELPSFTVLENTAERMRAELHRTLFQQVVDLLDEASRTKLDDLLTAPGKTLSTTRWNDLKLEPGRPTLKQVREWLLHQQWLSSLQLPIKLDGLFSEAKLLHFAEEAKSLNAARMQEMEARKRYTLMLCLLHVQDASVLDSLTELFNRRLAKITSLAQAQLERERAAAEGRVNALVATLRGVASAYQQEGSQRERLMQIGQVLGEPAQVIASCEAHEALAQNNPAPFLWSNYSSSRSALHSVLRVLNPQSSSQDTSVVRALRFVFQHATARQEYLIVHGSLKVGGADDLDLNWIPDGWWKLVTGLTRRDEVVRQVHRRHLETCVMTQVREDLRSGDLFVPGSREYADYRTQLVSDEEFQALVSQFCEEAGLPRYGAAFVERGRTWLLETAHDTDASFPHNEALTIVQGVPQLTRLKQKEDHPQLKWLEGTVKERLLQRETQILDAFTATELETRFSQEFGPLSGYEARLLNAPERYLTAVFCYGCNLGPSQTARALNDVDRKHLEWVNLRHITEKTLDQAIARVINAYARLSLPGVWGTGQRASADGTKWNVYEENLLAEYHLRYGGYGGIGYYHVSDMYIALYSHFIPCGVYEARYILDGLLRNESDLQPDTVHADTHGQSTPVFAIAYLLGIQLMPRIKEWKNLIFFHPDRREAFEHINDLFGESINWALIEDHYDDLLRVCVSIQAGRIYPSSILKRLGSAGRKRNRLYHAFRELGRAVRTAFLMRYIADPELRATIQAAVTKSEQFNVFKDWVAFGGDVINSNDRDEQRKRIKYNHLAANCVIFHTACQLTQVVKELLSEGHSISREALAGISPYLTEHINRLGNYTLKLERVLDVDYDFKLPE